MLFLMLESLFDPSVVWVLIPLTALAIPIVAILSGRRGAQLNHRAREESRKLYERIVLEKLDVMKTAIAMGYSTEDLSDLDARLEKLVGSEKLKSLLNSEDPKPPQVDDDLLQVELEEELRQAKKNSSGEVV